MAEPTTTLTDYLLALLALVLALRLAWMAQSSGDAVQWLWALGFLAAALGAALGGTSHGFGPHMAAANRANLWLGSLLAVLAGNALLSAAVTTMALVGPARRVVLAMIAVQLAVFAFAVIARPEFRVAIIDSALALALVVALSLWALAHGPAPWAAWVLAAAGFAVAGAAVQALHLAPHPRFNHNDLYHVLQAVALALLYRGATVSGG